MTILENGRWYKDPPQEQPLNHNYLPLNNFYFKGFLSLGIISQKDIFVVYIIRHYQQNNCLLHHCSCPGCWLYVSVTQAGSTLPTAMSRKQPAEKTITWEPNSNKLVLPFILDLSKSAQPFILDCSNSGGSHIPNSRTMRMKDSFIQRVVKVQSQLPKAGLLCYLASR